MIITLDEEEQLWSKGVLGDSSPQQLLDTLIYLFGIHLALRGGSEHRRLCLENLQIVKGKDKRTGLEYLEYRENISKTNAGGLTDRKIRGKITRAYENRADKKRCIVRLYDRLLIYGKYFILSNRTVGLLFLVDTVNLIHFYTCLAQVWHLEAQTHFIEVL